MSRDGGVDDTDLLLIDGDNLLHDVRGSRDEGGVAWLLPRLASWRPLHLRIVVGLDGHAAPGEASRTRATRGIEEMTADAWRWQSLNPDGYGS